MAGADRPEAPGSPARGGGRIEPAAAAAGYARLPRVFRRGLGARARWACRAAAAIYAAWLAALAVAAIVHRIS